MSLFDNSFPFRSCPVCRERELKEAAEKDMQQAFLAAQFVSQREQIKKEILFKQSVDKLIGVDNENVGET